MRIARKIAALAALLIAAVTAACSDSGNSEILGRWVITDVQDKVYTDNYFQQRIREQAVSANFPKGAVIEFMKKGLAHANGISIEYDFPERGKLRMRTGDGAPDTMVDYVINGDRMEWDYGDVIVTFERDSGGSGQKSEPVEGAGGQTDETIGDAGGQTGEPAGDGGDTRGESADGGGTAQTYEPLPADYRTLALDAFVQMQGTWRGYTDNERQQIEITIHELNLNDGMGVDGDGQNLLTALKNFVATVTLSANGNVPADDNYKPADAVFVTTGNLYFFRKSGDDDYTVKVMTSTWKDWKKRDNNADLEKFSLSFEVPAGRPNGPAEGIINPGGGTLTGMTKVQ